MESASCAPECSPFSIPHEQAQALLASPAFQLLRHRLADHTSFCPDHAGSDSRARDTWLLHRDILHALVMPVVELYRRACSLALCATQPREDLELAFSGEARGAFVWLQCFLGEEPDWCHTRGCPACITIETLSTESHVRLTVASILLSADAPPVPGAEPLPPTGLALPPLSHVLPAVREALDKDPFWGSQYWPYLFERGNQLSNNIEALIFSCLDLESLVAYPITHGPGPITNVNRAAKGEERGVKLRKSKLAKRQLRMKGEEMEILRRYVLQCWAKAVVPAHMRNELLGRGQSRRRSLTCP